MAMNTYTLAQAISDELDRLLMQAEAVNPGRHRDLFSTLNHDTEEYVPALNTFLADIPMNAITVWAHHLPENGGLESVGVLITPSLLACANHLQLNENFPVKLLTLSGSVVSRNIVDKDNVGDFCICKLDAPLEENDVVPWKIADAAWLEKWAGTEGVFDSGNGAPVLRTNKYRRVSVHNLESFSTTASSPPSLEANGELTGLRALYSEETQGGDSGHPIFVIYEGEPVLLSITSNGSPNGPSCASSIAAIEAIVADLAPGESLTYADVSGFPDGAEPTALDPTTWNDTELDGNFYNEANWSNGIPDWTKEAILDSDNTFSGNFPTNPNPQATVGAAQMIHVGECNLPSLIVNNNVRVEGCVATIRRQRNSAASILVTVGYDYGSFGANFCMAPVTVTANNTLGANCFGDVTLEENAHIVSGVYYGNVDTSTGATISGGYFGGNVSIVGTTISSGVTFFSSSTLTADNSSTIESGTFNGTVTSLAQTVGGTYNGTLTMVSGFADAHDLAINGTLNWPDISQSVFSDINITFGPSAVLNYVGGNSVLVYSPYQLAKTTNFLGNMVITSSGGVSVEAPGGYVANVLGKLVIAGDPVPANNTLSGISFNYSGEGTGLLVIDSGLKTYFEDELGITFSNFSTEVAPQPKRRVHPRRRLIQRS